MDESSYLPNGLTLSVTLAAALNEELSKSLYAHLPSHVAYLEAVTALHKTQPEAFDYAAPGDRMALLLIGR